MANDWKNKLRSEFEHYEEAEPEGLWAAVRDSLASADGLRAASGQGSRSPSGKRRHAPEQYRRRYARAAAFGSFVAAAGLAVALIPDWGGRQTVPSPVDGFPVREELLSENGHQIADGFPVQGELLSEAVSSASAALPASSATDGAEGGGSAFADIPAPVQPSPDAGSYVKPVGAGESVGSGASDGSGNSGESAEYAGTRESARSVDPAVPGASGESGGQLIFEDAGDFSTLDEDASRVSGRRKVLSLKLAVASSSFSSTSHSGYGAMYGSSVAAFRFSATPVADDGYSAVLLKNNYQEVSTTSRHYLPVNVGFSLGWEFAPGFSLSAGVDYTCLVSDLSSGTDATRYETRQTMHYLGIPVTLEWSFVQRSRLRAYLYAGGQARKAVYGTSSTRYVIDSAPWEPVIEKIGETPLQWSAGAGAGVEYMLGDKVGLYAEPGLNYYFDNGSPVENVFKSRPMNFNLTLGLRLKL